MSDVAAPTRRVRPETSGPVLGMVLFVASEAMFFATFFGAYFTIKVNAGLAAGRLAAPEARHRHDPHGDADRSAA